MNSSFWISIFIQRKDGKKVMNYKIVEQVSRKKKSMSGVLRVVMIIFAVLFVVMGITISQAFMLPGFLLAGLYFVFDIFSQKDYEYMMENGQFEIDVIYGKKYRKTAHILELSNLETVAPHWHESVARYKKNGGTEKLKKYERDQAKIEQLTRAAEQMHLWAFMGADKLHKRAFSMEKRIEKLSQSERPAEQKKLNVKFRQREFEGDEVLVAEDVSKSFGERTLFSAIDLLVRGGERVALIGDNGTGKSTLVKLIMGEETPDTGYLYRGPAVRTAYLPQIVSFSDESRSALDTMLYDCRCQPQEARDRLAAFGFRGESVFTPVGTLSGGEKSRLRLCMLMGADINFLILDEPTNHLDIASREWMEDALSDYEQTLLFVSHDRYFIEKFATRIWALADGKITDFRGGYGDYCKWRERQEVFAQTERNTTRKKAVKKEPSPNKERASAKLEREIAKLEEKAAELERQCGEYSADYQKLMELDAQKKDLDDELMLLYEKWEELNQ